MKNIVVVALLALFSVSASAQQKKNKNAKHDIEVKGNCDMCKKLCRKSGL